MCRSEREGSSRATTELKRRRNLREPDDIEVTDSSFSRARAAQQWLLKVYLAVLVILSLR